MKQFTAVAAGGILKCYAKPSSGRALKARDISIIEAANF